jgi:alpha-tubulin suppressor-like RCC1 family protein
VVKRVAFVSLALAAALSSACGGNTLDVGGNGNDGTEPVGRDSAPLRCPSSDRVVSETRVSVGTGHACAILDDLSLACWGFNDGGQVGVGREASDTSTQGDHTYAFALQPRRVEGLSQVAQVSASWQTTCALTCDGAVYCWGANAMGVFGKDSPKSSSSPIRVEGLGDDVVEVRSGGGPACARKRDGSVWCWGQPTYGNVGVPIPEVPSGQPQPVTPPTRVAAVHDAVEIAVSDSLSCARDKDGHVSCWGAVQLDPTGYMPASEKVRSIPGVERARQLALAQTAGFALVEDGSLWAWGSQRGTQERSALAIVSEYDYVAPTRVPDLGGIRAISADYGTACALRNDDRVVCWGDNGQGQLGRGTLGDRAWAAPAEVPGVSAATLSVGTWSVCAGTTERKVVCWGASGFGALGTGVKENTAAPPGPPVSLP